jgi:hypothetical protein
MAILQAARASALGLPQDSAYSWGLNRAIFYAAAKRGFRGGGRLQAGKKDGGEEKPHVTETQEEDEFFLGDEKAYLDRESSKKNEPVFEIGSEAQTAGDFEKQISSRFGSKANFDEAWKEALKLVKSHDEETLKSQHEFFEQVYRPKRDVLSKKWTEEFAKSPSR